MQTNSPKIFISTWPFGKIDKTPIKLLADSGFENHFNTLGRKLKPEELAEIAYDYDGIIAGTENLDLLLDKTTRLKFISRVGIGLDSVPLARCKELGIRVSFTPDAVTKSVAEIVIGVMISLLRLIPQADKEIRMGGWSRFVGTRIGESVIGIVGMGRIGSEVIRMLANFNPKLILINDIKDKTDAITALKEKHSLNIRYADKPELFKLSDIVSLHLPLSNKSAHLINLQVLSIFKRNSYLINFSRGGIVNEEDLCKALDNKIISGAAIDVFEKEPYSGKLCEYPNIILTQHMGACTEDGRKEMETQAAEEIIRFFQGKKLHHEVPPDEYEYQLCD